MTTIQTKTILFKITNNTKINHIINQQGTLFVKATISFEESDTYESSYYGYYDMQWLALSSKEKLYIISDKFRSKVLAILAESYYKEDEAFHLHENHLYDFSEIEIRSIVDIVN